MNSLEVLFSSKECDIYYNNDYRLIQSKWKGIFVEGQRLKEIFNLLILMLDLKKTDMIIADAREMMNITDADQQWTVNDWYPRAVKTGFRYQGLILSKNSFNEISVKEITSNYNDAIVVTQYFDSPEEALKWAGTIKNHEHLKSKIED